MQRAKRQAQPELPIIRDPEESWYLRQERDGFILGPYEKQAQVWSVDGVPPAFGAELMPPDLDRVEHIIEMAMARVPALANGGVKTVINGPITFTPDANPLIGPAHGVPNAWLLTGSSMGVMEGGGAGKFLAHWMVHGAPMMDALAVDPRRFGAWADRDFRVAKAVECFGLQFGVHYPFEERPAARNIRTSALHDLMIERGAVMGAPHASERPNWFSTKPHDETRDSFRRTNWLEAVAREVDAVQNRVALADLSVFSKFDDQWSGYIALSRCSGRQQATEAGSRWPDLCANARRRCCLRIHCRNGERGSCLPDISCCLRRNGSGSTHGARIRFRRQDHQQDG